MTFAALRARWFDGWARFFPEDVTSLGVRGHASRLREGAAGDAERDFHETMLAELATIETSGDEAIERDAIERASRFRAHVLAHDHDRRCLELSSYPHAMIGHHLAHARDAADLEDALARLDALPAVLAARERALTEGVARGHTADQGIVEVFVGYVLPGAARTLGAMHHELLRDAAKRAAMATEAHRSFVEREIAPRSAIGAACLGEEELDARLAWTYGEPISARALLRETSDAIDLATGRLVLAAARSARARDLVVRDRADALAYVGTLFRETLDEGCDVATTIASHVDRAARFAAERRLFRVPAESPAYVAIPDGMIHGGSITNWPAPLCDRSRCGHVALSMLPSAHVPAFVPNLAIHEATPGHFLQSAVWRERFGHSTEPVRFAAVHDEVACASSWFGAMPAVEGFAVHAEHVMLDAGFHDADGEVAAIASASIRAARAACDLSLHLRDVTPDEAASRLSATTGMPRPWCQAQVVRVLRIPIQATTYFVGGQRHRAMLDDARARLGGRFRADVFHDRLLAIGPASLGQLAACSRAAVDDARREP
jgi:uncharacterized protein (DUF885 family)